MTQESFEEGAAFLRFSCPVEECSCMGLDRSIQYRHVPRAHHKHLCKMCKAENKMFVYERKLFEFCEVRRHHVLMHPQCEMMKTKIDDDEELCEHFAMHKSRGVSQAKVFGLGRTVVAARNL